jgi:S1-C subfamily serine protease
MTTNTTPNSPQPGSSPAAPETAPRRSGGSILLLVALVAGLGGGGVVAAVNSATKGSETKTVTTSVHVAAAQSNEVATTSGSRPSLNQIYRNDAPGVVTVTATSTVSASSSIPGVPGGTQSQTALGSGFVLDKNGYILTNEHVIDKARKVEISFASGAAVTATIVGSDRATDLAVLKVDMPASALHPLALGSSSSLKVGDPVVAIGNPFGLDRTMTAGIVSALQRDIQAPNGFDIANAIQTDAAINHGNSGGPLINALNGDVVGINAQLPSNQTVNGNLGIGFAIPIDLAKTVITQLRSHGAVSHAWLGVSLTNIDQNLTQNAKVQAARGVLVTGVVPGSPADRAGLHGGSSPQTFNGTPYCLGGDAVTGIDGHSVSNVNQLRSVIAGHRPGDSISLAVVRPSGSHTTVKVTLGTEPSQAPTTSTTRC